MVIPVLGNMCHRPKSKFSARLVTGLSTLLILLLASAQTASAAETRRAFLVGIERYTDSYVQRLDRTANDARDLAKDLEQLGFDKKNIKVAVDLKNRDAFEKEFSAFLKTVESGDEVVFFFSGHGFGVEADQTNYLLFADLKSPFTYAKSRLTDQERKNPDVVKLRISQHLDAYQQNEIPNGVSANEIQRRLAERNPKTVIMILDACRSLVDSDVSGSQEVKVVRRGSDSGSRLLNMRKPPPGFLILYSAAFGEQAVESFGGTDNGRNSLFTGVLRTELQRPEQSAIELGQRVKLVVRSIAHTGGRQQEPELFYDETNSTKLNDFQFVGPIGREKIREKFRVSQDRCVGAGSDWDQIKDLQKRELYDRHIRRFDTCMGGTAEAARRALATLALSSDDPIEAIVTTRSINDCDRLAASPIDTARPPEVPGVLLAKLDSDLAIPACKKAVEENPRVTRYLFNLGRAYQALATGLVDDERRRALDSARLAYDDASRRGYVSARRALVALTQGSDDSEGAGDCDRLAASPLDSARPPEIPGVLQTKLDPDLAIPVCKKAADENSRITRYLFNLGRAYQVLASRPGLGDDDRRRALDSAKFAYDDAAKRGYVSALNDLAALHELDKNYEQAVDLFQRAAQQRHPLGMYNLALRFRDGVRNRDGAVVLPRDVGQAAEWFAQAAASGLVSAMIENAWALWSGRGQPKGMPNPRRAVEWMQRAADAGAVRAMYLLGYFYQFGRDTNKDTLPVNRDPELALLWYGRAAEAGHADAQVQVALIMEKGEGVLSPQPEIAGRYWRLAARSGDAYAQVEFANKLRQGLLLVKEEYGAQEIIDLLTRAISQGSAHAAVALAQIYGRGELGQLKNDPDKNYELEAIRLAYLAIDLAVLTDPAALEGNPYYEISAGHLLAELFENTRSPEVRNLLPSIVEIERLKSSYGFVKSGAVQVRRLEVPIYCFLRSDLVKGKTVYTPTSHIWQSIWIWDWGRAESPTELQIRDIERRTRCRYNHDLRATLMDLFAQAKKNKLAFAEYVDQRIETIQGRADPKEQTGDRKKRRR